MKKKFVAAILTGVMLALSSCGQAKTADEIHVYTRDSSSGTREAFSVGIGLLKNKKDMLTASAVETSGNGDMATKVGKDPAGIGYTSLSTDFKKNGIRPVKYEGVEATKENVLSHKYKLFRPFSFVTRAKGDYDSPEKEAVIDAFLVFLTKSKEGVGAVEGAGGIVDSEKTEPWAVLSKDMPALKKDLSGITIKTAGSTSVEKTLQAALEAFKALTGVNFQMNQTGSGDGFKRVLGKEKDGANYADIGFASRHFNTDSSEPQAMLDKASMHGVYALDAVVVVVNDKNTAVTNLTKDQLFKIFSGEIKKFSEIK